VTAKVQPEAGIQLRVRAEMAVNVVRVRLLSRAVKAKRLLPSKAAVTSTMMKAANRILIAKTQTAKLLPQEGRSVQEAIVRMAVEAEIVEVVAAGIAEVAVAEVPGVIVVLVAAVEIAAIAN
jgi:hypothetical protein